MTTNEFVVVGAVGARPSVRALDRGRVHQARFDVWTGEDAIPCQLTRSDSKGLRRLTDGLEPGRMVVVTGLLDTRIAEVGGLRLPVLIPFVQHVQAGEVVASAPNDPAGDAGGLRVPIGFTRFRVEGMVAAEVRRSRVGRGHGAHVAVRSGQRTVPLAVIAGSGDDLDRKTIGLVAGAGVTAVGYLRNRTTGGGLSVLEAVAFTVQVERPVGIDLPSEIAPNAGSMREDRCGETEVETPSGGIRNTSPFATPGPALAVAAPSVSPGVLA